MLIFAACMQISLPHPWKSQVAVSAVRNLVTCALVTPKVRRHFSAPRDVLV